MSIQLSYGLENVINVPSEDFATVGDLVGSARIKTFLNLPENGEYVVDGVVVTANHEIFDGDVISVRQKAGAKGMASGVKVAYGLSNEASTDLATVGAIRTDARLQAFLGYSPSVEAVINGVVVDDSYAVAPGDTVSLRAKAGAKGC